MADDDLSGVSDDHDEQHADRLERRVERANRHAAAARSPRMHLPARRRASPWSRRVVLVVLAALVLSVPLWIDPMTLRELRGEAPTPAAPTTPPPSPVPPEALT